MLGTAIAHLGGVIREGRCCDLGNFSRTRVSGKQLFGPMLAKARSGLVPVFQAAGIKTGSVLGII